MSTTKDQTSTEVGAPKCKHCGKPHFWGVYGSGIEDYYCSSECHRAYYLKQTPKALTSPLALGDAQAVRRYLEHRVLIEHDLICAIELGKIYGQQAVSHSESLTPRLLERERHQAALREDGLWRAGDTPSS